MTAEIYTQIAGREHVTKQPDGFPYALFCKPVLDGEGLVECPSRKRMGFIDNFRRKKDVKTAGRSHPHAVLIRDFKSSR